MAGIPIPELPWVPDAVPLQQSINLLMSSQVAGADQAVVQSVSAWSMS